MSRKNRDNRTVNAAAITDDNDRHLHAVVDDPRQQNEPSTEDKVRAALTDNPVSTTAKLAMAAGVGRSTAAKILARWDREGTAIRTAGDGPRNPDTWTVAPSDRDTAAPDTDDVQPDATAATPSTDQPTEHASDTVTTAEQTRATGEATIDVDDSATEDTTVAEAPGTTSETDDDNATTDTTNHAPAPSTNADDDKSGGTTSPPGTAPQDPVDSATEAEPCPAETPAVADTTPTTPTDKDRLRKGGLRALVEEYLTTHPGESFGPAKIGKDLVRSGGAVNNALEKLVADGYAIKTCEAPKRFAINPDKTDVPETANHGA
ncbi:hypothetical protein SAMN05216266_11717 [Amycolatopsis marina]|uniref:Uncharacterized protein n=1 Tax=Amycolatopsis marina TaxID=490629 RepID=A0A1I1BXD4_9PSEU|nr:hypothetical protein [Amycolatopsis marina]SFB53318.1 hypothetical protein SAMN05216266_11717 [Amycolatopsis marina]